MSDKSEDYIKRASERGKKDPKESRKEEVYESYRRIYPEMTVDFVHKEDLKEILKEISSALTEMNRSSGLFNSTISIRFTDTIANQLILPAGLKDHDGSRLDVPVRISSRSNIRSRIF